MLDLVVPSSWLRRLRRLAGVCFVVWPPVAASAQTLGGPRPATTAPREAGLLTAFRPGLDVTHILNADDMARFNWDLDMSVELDLFDLGFLRGNMFGSFETIIGSENRSVDPNQANYTMDLSMFVRLPRGELSVTTHHVSRHLIDRATNDSVSWNMIGVSYGDRFAIGRVDLVAGARGMATVDRSGVDYDGQFEGFVTMARSVRNWVAVIAGADGTLVPVTRATFGRDTRRGGRLEAGLRLFTGMSTLDVFVAREHRIDAEVGDPDTARWTEVGFRLAASLP